MSAAVNVRVGRLPRLSTTMPARALLRAFAVLLSAVPFCGSPCRAQEIAMEARVVAIRDGDTLEVHRSGRTYLLDVAEIDCPELKQPFGAEARQATAELTDGATIEVGLRELPGSGLVGSVRLPDGRDLAAELLGRGLAWWAGGAEGDQVLRVRERQARTAGRGLWTHPDPVPPWTFRGDRPPVTPPEREHAAASAQPPRPPPPAPSNCIPRSQCCRVCGKGKACGNSCINVSFNCHKGRGCACNSYEICP